MLKIEIKIVDELFEISLHLSMLSYLQELLQLDVNEQFICREDSEGVRRRAFDYLCEKQSDTAFRLRRLLNSLPF